MGFGELRHRRGGEGVKEPFRIDGRRQEGGKDIYKWQYVQGSGGRRQRLVRWRVPGTRHVPLFGSRIESFTQKANAKQRVKCCMDKGEG